MESISCELKYCEGCGTLKLRPVKSVTNHCAICERMLARFRYPRAALARHYAGLPSADMLKKLPLAVCGAAAGGRSQ